MKKLLLLGLLCLLGATNVSAKDPVSLKSGDISVLKKKATAVPEFDYSSTKVGDKTLDEHMENRKGEDLFTEKNEAVIDMFIRSFKKNKGMKLVKYTTDVPYKIVVHVSSLDMGNGGGVIFAGGIATQKAGGMTMSGTVDIMDMETGEAVCTFNVDKLKGLSGINVKVRLLMLYSDLANRIRKLNR